MKAKVAYAVLLCLMGYGAGAMANGEKRGLSPIIPQATNITAKPGVILSICEPVQTPDSPNGQLGGGCRRR